MRVQVSDKMTGTTRTDGRETGNKTPQPNVKGSYCPVCVRSGPLVYELVTKISVPINIIIIISHERHGKESQQGDLFEQ